LPDRRRRRACRLRHARRYLTAGGQATAAAPPRASVSRREWILTLAAALFWAAFNSGYIVYLSFAPQVLTAGGASAL
jgi:hypothetical protein